MNRLMLVLAMLVLSAAAWAMPLGTATRTAIPSDIQQIISVDYRTMKDSNTAMALKAQVLPENLKQFETALKGMGIDPEKDLDQLTFASYRMKQSTRVVGVAQGQFSGKAVVKKLQLRKIRPVKYRTNDIYPMAGGMSMVFLEEDTLVFADMAALKDALDARDGYTSALDANSQIVDMIGAVDSGTVWSVLDQQGTQNMMRSALGDASKLADFDSIKKRLVGSRYTMDFNSGVKFDLDVVASDSITASTLASLVKAGMLYRRQVATATEKTALENVSVDSDSSNIQFHFKTDDKQFQSLLHSDLFAAVSR